ncbi:MAG: alpha/beta fold hydrolase [Verrucomicrobiota bacterium]
MILYLGQGRLIYLPRSYYSGMPEFEQVNIVSYLSNGKKQHVFLPERKRTEPPDRVWWVFGGNGSLALDWIGFLDSAPADSGITFVLFDYPGYGLNEGSPNPHRIADSIDDALPPVAEAFDISKDELIERSSVLGHSLGAAVAFDFADRYELDRIVAVSPFTTMEEMAKRTMGAWVTPLLTHRYDNEKALDGILHSGKKVRITIFHGEEDRLIPMAMGQSLAARDKDGDAIEFIPVPKAGHNDVISRILYELIHLFEV